MGEKRVSLYNKEVQTCFFLFIALKYATTAVVVQKHVEMNSEGWLPMINLNVFTDTGQGESSFWHKQINWFVRHWCSRPSLYPWPNFPINCCLTCICFFIDKLLKECYSQNNHTSITNVLSLVSFWRPHCSLHCSVSPNVKSHNLLASALSLASGLVSAKLLSA